MDIGRIGGSQNVPPMNAVGNIAAAAQKSSIEVKDVFVNDNAPDFQAGPPEINIKAPDRVDSVESSEINDVNSGADVASTGKPSREIINNEGYILFSGMEEGSGFFGGLNLNGPSTLGEGIKTLNGENVNNPRFLIQE